MRKNENRTNAGVLDPPDQTEVPAADCPRVVHAANDNGPGRRRVILMNFQTLPIKLDEIAVIDRLMQEWPSAANDNAPVI